MKLLKNTAIAASIIAMAACGASDEEQVNSNEFTELQQDYSELPQGLIARVPVDSMGNVLNQMPEVRSHFGNDLSATNVDQAFQNGLASNVYGQDNFDLANPMMFNVPGQFLGSNGKVGQYPGQYPGKGVGQYPGQYPGKGVGQYPGQYPGKGVGQYPGQHPGKGVGQYPGQYPSIPGKGVGQYPGKGVGQYPGQYPGKNTRGIGQFPGQHPHKGGKGGKGGKGVHQSPWQYATDISQASSSYNYSYKLDYEVNYSNDYFMNQFRPIHRSRYYPNYNWGYYGKPNRWIRNGFCYYFYRRPRCSSYTWCSY